MNVFYQVVLDFKYIIALKSYVCVINVVDG